MSFGTRCLDSFRPSCSIVSLPFEKEPSSAAWNPLSNETSLTGSMADFLVTQRYQPNTRHSYIANSALNSSGNTVSSPNWADNEHFMLDVGMPASSCISTSTNRNMNPLILGSDMIANSRSSFPSSNVQGQFQFLNTSGCLSRSQCRPPMGGTQTPFHLSNKPYWDSNPFLSCQKEGHYVGNKLFSSPYKKEDLSNVPINMSSQNRTWMPLPQTQQNGMQSPLPAKDLQSNRLAANCESNPMRREVVKLQSLLYLCNHAFGCVDGCNRVGCKYMKMLYNHCCNCRNNLCEQSCAGYKMYFKHYEECCSSDCLICPPAKVRPGDFQGLNSGSTKVRTSIVTSDYDQQSIKPAMKCQEPSPSTSFASELTDIEHATQTHFSQSQKVETLNSIFEYTRMEINQSKTLSMANKGKLFEAEVKNLNFACNLLQETKTDGSDNVIVEGRLQNMQTPCSLPCKVENFEELSFPESTNPSSQEAIYERKKLITSEDSVVEGIGLKRKLSGSHDSNEGLTPLVPHVQCEVLEASLNSIDETLKGEHNCSESILSASKMKYPEPKFVGLSCAMEVQQSVNPVYAEGIATQSEPHIMQKCCEAEAEASHDTTCSLGGPELRKETERAISLPNLFPPEELRVHISNLRQSINPVKSTTQKMNGPETQISNPCSLCGMDKLFFQPPIRYCSACMKKINPRGIYYCLKDTDTSAGALKSFCNSCYAASREKIKFAKQYILKAHLEQRTNYAETDGTSEKLVQCQKCKEWLHEICALFNGKLDKVNSSKVEFVCPICCLRDIENGVREPLLRRLVVGAKELPRTKLSDHIEEWLFMRLRDERQERAKKLGKNINEVPTAEDLVVRLVSSVDTKFEVKQCFREIFKEDNYPVEFAYKSKAVMLFQVIEGADVLLFAMYVQEYGSECSEPNRRHVCISYIDSVKYFRPEVRAVSGEALRTFVYHELLIGYLDYCKRRGFTSCYIWACPPSKDDNYILYCHPMSQKIPKSDKLREWYQKMIRKASKGKIVMENTNLYDHFFVQTRESIVNITAARLPYFDRDYWPGEAENLIQSYNEKRPQKKAKAAIERALRAAKRDASSIENEKDVLLMNNLGSTIRPMKEDFIILFLHHTCGHCCQPIISGGCWVCNMCKNFQLCGRCHSFEGKLQHTDRHPINARDKHSFHKVELEGVPQDTYDEDETRQCEILTTRLEFLNFCEGNHYQFDTLRRAKHSTMMILYNLHNPAPPFSESSHNVGMDNAQGMLSSSSSPNCQFDSDYHEECNGQPKLCPNTRMQSPEMLTLMDALLHASKCGTRTCAYAHCHRLKVLFHHGVTCIIRKQGGCKLCAKMWLLISSHALYCRDLECAVPRCKDMKGSFALTRVRCSEREIRPLPETDVCMTDA
ncbi:histone acetyltransferase HAC1-like [Phalaenopsis equestris]|uniref:histone acetyltransferase HAC1-like n=1 Tax=Phalaenopsis equestris TaxID=78828 RepID=UPI0009E5E466|nr:histone acetyltransferase HAC1-like [Phalaenopsis equestris]